MSKSDTSSSPEMSLGSNMSLVVNDIFFNNVTHFGGIFLVHQFCKKLRLKWHLQKKVLFRQQL